MTHRYKNGNTDQRNKIESPEINPCTYIQVIYNKGVKNIQWTKKISSINDAGKLDNYMENKEIKTFSNNTHTYINSKWSKDLNVRLDTVNLLKEKIPRTSLI